MRIAIQGELGSFSHEATLLFAPELGMDEPPELHTCALSAEVFQQLIAGEVDAAVIPIENSLAGSVLEHYDLLLASPVRIEAERMLRIRHQLIASSGATIEGVCEVYSHPVALAQCRRLFNNHPKLRAMPFYDTAGSVAHAVKVGGSSAAIASQYAAQVYGGEVLLADVEDHAANYTRFLLIRPAAAPALNERVENKVSIAFAVPNRPGSLVEVLAIFTRHNLNLTRLESRPVPGSPWEYVFYADYQLASEEQAAQALAAMTQVCSLVKELGRYAAAAPIL